MNRIRRFVASFLLATLLLPETALAWDVPEGIVLPDQSGQVTSQSGVADPDRSDEESVRRVREKLVREDEAAPEEVRMPTNKELDEIWRAQIEDDNARLARLDARPLPPLSFAWRATELACDGIDWWAVGSTTYFFAKSGLDSNSTDMKVAGLAAASGSAAFFYLVHKYLKRHSHRTIVDSPYWPDEYRKGDAINMRIHWAILAAFAAAPPTWLGVKGQ